MDMRFAPVAAAITCGTVAIAMGLLHARYTLVAEHLAQQRLGSKRMSVVLFGDSLTERAFAEGGWGGCTAHWLQRRADVFNRGFGGYNTRQARAMLPALFPLGPHEHLLVTVWFGANDAADASMAVHVPLEEYANNLRDVLVELRRVAKHVVVLTPPPLHAPTRLAYQKRKYGAKATGVLERTTEVTGQYARAAQRVAADLELPTLDVHRGMLAEGEDVWPAYVGAHDAADGDGLHLSAEGQRWIGKKLLDLLAHELRLPRDLDAKTPNVWPPADSYGVSPS